MQYNFDFDWRFFQGDLQEAQVANLDDSSWQSVNVPHDFSIFGSIDEANPSGRSMGWYPAGIGWYRKTFTIPPHMQGRKIFIDFDGIYWKSDVWINGVHLGFRPNGYIGFRYDLTPHVNLEGTNVLAVRVDNSEQPNTRWYSGSGIYRHCRLVALNPIHIAHWGTYITQPNVSESSATIHLSATINNAFDQPKRAEIRSSIYDSQKNLIACESCRMDFAPHSSGSVDLEFSIDAPKLWSPRNPHLYSVKTEVIENGCCVDCHTDPLGIRFIEFDPTTGFSINGEHMKLKGVNIHQNVGGVGAAAPDRMIERRLELLKRMGCNAIRTAHYPHSPVFMDLCDRMGFLVMDEAFDGWWMPKRDFGYHQYFFDWWERDLTDQIRRDRNHPCVILWSIGNENHERKTTEGAEHARKMVDFIHRLEPTRPVTAGVNHVHWANDSGFAQQLDVVGYNDGGGSCFHYLDHKEQFPDRRAFGSETPHTFSTRGVFRTRTRHKGEGGEGGDFVKGKEHIEVPHLTDKEIFPFFHDAYQSSYDNANTILGIRDAWKITNSADFICGEFRWTGLDYIGESHGWPARSSNSGLSDLCGFPKDTYYIYQRLWTDKPMLHVLPHWSWPQVKEGTIIPIWVLSNCDSVELFLNGQSLGEKPVDGADYLGWDVPYQPGLLKAVARKDGKILLVAEHRTAEKPERIELSFDRPLLNADGQDVAHVTVRVIDRNGVMVPHANHRIHFDVSGAGALLGVENGDPIDHDGCKEQSRKAFHGMGLAIVQTLRSPGTILIRAEAEGLAPAAVEIMSKSA